MSPLSRGLDGRSPEEAMSVLSRVVVALSVALAVTVAALAGDGIAESIRRLESLVQDGSYDEAVAYLNYAMTYQQHAMEGARRKLGADFFEIGIGQRAFGFADPGYFKIRREHILQKF